MRILVIRGRKVSTSAKRITPAMETVIWFALGRYKKWVSKKAW